MNNGIQFAIVLLLFGYIIWLQQCGPASTPGQRTGSLQPDTTVRIDTVYPPPVVVQLPPQPIPPPTVVYLDTHTQQYHSEAMDTGAVPIKQYTDSITDENLSIRYTAWVDGELLDHALQYTLKAPREITKTVTIREPQLIPAAQVLFKTGVSVDPVTGVGVSVGLEYLSARRWSAGYQYDVLQKRHQINIGFRLWSNASK